MTGQLKLISTQTDDSRWQKFLAWIESITMAIDHDSLGYTYTSINILREELEQLKNRVIELERNGKRHGSARKGQNDYVGENYEY